LKHSKPGLTGEGIYCVVQKGEANITELNLDDFIGNWYFFATMSNVLQFSNGVMENIGQAVMLSIPRGQNIHLRW